MDSDARPAGPVSGLVPPRPVHHIGFHVSDLRAAIDAWLAVYGAGPFYVSEHVAYDECTSGGTPAVWDHSAAFCQWGALPVELQQTHASGAIYVLAWVVGLVTAPSAPSQPDPDVKVQAFFLHHHTATLIQAVLVRLGPEKS